MGDETPLLVGAIDLGTSYSGWAYSFEDNMNSISSIGWHTVSRTLTGKTPTTLLIEPDGKKFNSFGYKAMEKYTSLSSGDKQKYFYFHHFKMKLYENVVDRNLILIDETGKPLSAKTVFSLAIGYLMNHMMKKVDNSLADPITRNKVMWVLTIPAIWNDAAKQFMREAAIEAGIEDKQLRVALEPEAASIYCRLVSFRKMELKMVPFISGSKYMLIDAGGGTVDISVHEVLDQGILKELHESSGGGWGGTLVDEAFLKFIIDLIGKPVFDKLKKEYANEFLELMDAFERSKRSFNYENDPLTIVIPSRFRSAIQKGKQAKKVKFDGDKLSVSASIMDVFFSGSIDHIIFHVKKLMTDTNVKDIPFIVMVGGFSKCRLLQDKIRSNFVHVKVITPSDAELAIVKGSVLYGYNPAVIKQRVCKKTYGVGTYTRFDPKEHDEKKKVSYDGINYCSDIFDMHVKVGETVTFNDVQSERAYIPLSENQTSLTLNIYGSSTKCIKYITDAGCHKLGTVTANLSDRSVPREERKVIVSMMFSGTEIKVFAKEKRTGKTENVCVDFLERKSKVIDLSV